MLHHNMSRSIEFKLMLNAREINAKTQVAKYPVWAPVDWVGHETSGSHLQLPSAGNYSVLVG